mgnify:CR=1 FL=1
MLTVLVKGRWGYTKSIPFTCCNFYCFRNSCGLSFLRVRVCVCVHVHLCTRMFEYMVLSCVEVRLSLKGVGHSPHFDVGFMLGARLYVLLTLLTVSCWYPLTSICVWCITFCMEACAACLRGWLSVCNKKIVCICPCGPSILSAVAGSINKLLTP